MAHQIIEYGRGYFPVDINPATKSFVIPAQPWTIDMPEKVIYSRQKGEWKTDPQYTFRADPAQGPLICARNNSMLNNGSDDAKFLNAIGDHLLNVIVNDVFIELIGQQKDSVLTDNTFAMQKQVEDSIRVRFRRIGYILENFVSNLNPPQVIIDKNRATNASAAASLQAKADVIKAEAEAKVKVATANADAQAFLITQKAEADAIRLKQQSLSPLVIQQTWIEKWDGALPYYTTDRGGIMSMQMPSIK